MKLRTLIMTVFLTCLVFSPFSTSMATQELSLGTSAVGGIYYTLGVPITQVVNKQIPGIHVTPEITIGTVENLRLLGQEKIQLGITLPLMAIKALNGEDPFKEKTPVRTVMRLTPVVNVFVALTGSGIKTHEDLKGKRVNLGQPGGLDQNSINLLATYGLTLKDIRPSVQGIGAGADALKDGKFDAVITTIPLINQLKATHDITILWPDEAHIDKLVANVPAYGKWLMPPGTVTGVDKPLYTPDFGTQLSCHVNADPDLIYKITKALMENLNDLTAMFSQYRYVTKEWAATTLGIPHHPGALKYYREAGLIK
jgi:uncharacterized protein